MFLPCVHSSLSKDETLDLELTLRREIEIAKETFGAFIFYDDFKKKRYKTVPKTVKISSPKNKSQLKTVINLERPPRTQCNRHQ